jgi:hypothetical protein
MQKYDFLFSFYIFFGTKILRLYAGRRSRRSALSRTTGATVRNARGIEAEPPSSREAAAKVMERIARRERAVGARSGSPKSLMC